MRIFLAFAYLQFDLKKKVTYDVYKKKRNKEKKNEIIDLLK